MFLSLWGTYVEWIPSPGGSVGPDVDALDIVNAKEVQIRHILCFTLTHPLAKTNVTNRSLVLTLDGSSAPGGGIGPDVDALDVVNAQDVRIRHTRLIFSMTHPLQKTTKYIKCLCGSYVEWIPSPWVRCWPRR